MSEETRSHLLTIQLSSALLEGISSIVFELLLLAVLAQLAQAICANYNVRRLYDKRLPVKLASPRLLLRTHVPVGHFPVAVILALLLLVATLFNNILSFAISGRSELLVELVSPRAVVSNFQEAKPPFINFDSEWALQEGDDSAEQPPLLSSRLRAIRFADECLECNYTDCTNYAFTVDDQVPNNTLIHPDTPMSITCLTPELFKDAEAWDTYERFAGRMPPEIPVIERSTAVSELATVARQEDACEITGVNASFAQGASLATATLKLGTCNIVPESAHCFQRGGRETRCAAMAPVPTGGLKVMGFPVPSPNAQPVTAEIVWVTKGHKMEKGDYARYAATVAFMDSVRMTDRLSLLQRMASAQVRDDQHVNRVRVGEQRLLSDIDLRITTPAVVYNVVLLVGMVLVHGGLWYAAVWREDRKGFNKMATVPEILEVIGDENEDRCRSHPSDRMGIGLDADEMQLVIERERAETFQAEA